MSNMYSMYVICRIELNGYIILLEIIDCEGHKGYVVVCILEKGQKNKKSTMKGKLGIRPKC